ASSLAGVANSLAQSAGNDTYMFCTGLTTDVGTVDADLAYVNGGLDPNTWENNFEDVSLVMVDRILSDLPAGVSSAADTELAHFAAQPAVFTFGLTVSRNDEHTPSGPAGIALPASDLMTAFGPGADVPARDQRANFNMFTRYPLWFAPTGVSGAQNAFD